jgi:hypothetical protein
MKQACSVVRDLLPLYLEDMVSEETGAFVKEHLESCPDCAAELEGMKGSPTVQPLRDETRSALDAEVSKSMKAVRQRFRKKAYGVAAVISAVVLVFCILLHFFPVYRVAEIGFHYYSGEQIGMALSIGSLSDRREAQSVLRLADQAFSDTHHTRAENEDAYGLLARYATSTDSVSDAAFNTHSLELWSAHLGEDEGWIWVYYSSETISRDGSTTKGSWNIPSLWRVEKNAAGDWVVVQIVEHA